MFYIPALNTSIPFYFAPLALLFFLTIVILSEAVVLYLLKWSRFRLALRDSAIVNLASTLLGLLYLQMVPLNIHASNWTIWLIGLMVSIGLESVILWRLREHSFGKALWRCALANLASYLILLAFLLLSVA